MFLTDEEKAMLDGRDGPAVQKAMELLVRYGEALGAENLVDTHNVGGYLFPHRAQMEKHGEDFDAALSEMDLDCDSPVKFSRVKVPSMQFETYCDPDYCAEQGYTEADRARYLANEEYLRGLGVQLMCSCTPYQLGNLPVYGEHCAWMESSAVVYINSVLGARTNCEGGESTTAAMLTGKIPNWGYHLQENRYGTHLVRVETPIETFEDWGLLGYFVGKKVQDKVPVIEGTFRQPTKDMLKQFGAASASSGGIELYHLVGVTPDARTREQAFGSRRPVDELVFGAAEKRWAYDLLNCTAKSRDVDFVMLGCPHYSLDQLWDLANRMEGRRVKDGVNFWVFAPRPIKDLAAQCGYLRTLEDAGVKVMCNTCPALGGFIPKGATVMATDSGKQAHYLPNFFPQLQSWYGSTGDCVQAALTGRWEGALT